MHKDGISIVIVSWNTKTVTDECLARIKKSTDDLGNRAEVEVVVVDNNSDDGTSGMIGKKYPWVKLVNSKVNLGYSKGNNLGFSITNPKNKYLLLLNSDAFIEKNTLAQSLEFIKNHGGCDVFGCKLIFPGGKFQPSAGNLPTPVNVYSWIFGLDLIPGVNKLFYQFHPRDPGFFKIERKVGWVQGAFLFMKREVFEKTKGFDEKFFMYMDEVEWSDRVLKLGYNIIYTPHFSVIHLDRASAHQIPGKLTRTYSLEIIGLIYYLRKHYPESLRLLLPLVKVAVFLRFLIFFAMGNKIRQEAYLSVLKEI